LQHGEIKYGVHTSLVRIIVNASVQPPSRSARSA
jgi:hypothetical protein